MQVEVETMDKMNSLLKQVFKLTVAALGSVSSISVCKVLAKYLPYRNSVAFVTIF